MFDIGGMEIMLILFIFLLLFGANKMPELARGIGKSVREFKKAASGVENEVRRAMEEEPEPVRPSSAPKPTGTIEHQAGMQPPAPPPAAD